jgi:hypothetical protein
VAELGDANGFFGSEDSDGLLVLKNEDVPGETSAFTATSVGLENEKLEEGAGAKGDAAAGAAAVSSVFSTGFVKENGEDEVEKDGTVGASVLSPVSTDLVKENGFEEPVRGEDETVLATGVSAGFVNEKGEADEVTAGASTG